MWFRRQTDHEPCQARERALRAELDLWKDKYAALVFQLIKKSKESRRDNQQ